MKRSLSLCLLGLFFFQPVVRADMIEIKKEGVFNGKILSQDDKQVRFKDAGGRERLFSREDVLFMEVDADAGKPLVEKVKKKAAELWRAAKKAPEAVRKGADDLTEKFIGVVGQPLDRSAANAKADQLAGALDQTNKTSAASINKARTVDKEITRQQKEAEGFASQNNEHKGRFTSL